jgi:hypothetical protein
VRCAPLNTGIEALRLVDQLEQRNFNPLTRINSSFLPFLDLLPSGGMWERCPEKPRERALGVTVSGFTPSVPLSLDFESFYHLTRDRLSCLSAMHTNH